MAAQKHRRTPRGRRLLRWTVNLGILTITLLCLAWLAPSAFGYDRYVITGGSMSGTFEKGSVVFEKPVPVEDLEVGDIITYQPPPEAGTQALVTHRIIKIEPAEGGGFLFTTQGDANADPDPWHFKLADAEQPVVEHTVPYAGWVFIALADKTTRILLIGGPATLIALSALLQVLRALRSGVADDTRPAADDVEILAPVPHLV